MSYLISAVVAVGLPAVIAFFIMRAPKNYFSRSELGEIRQERVSMVDVRHLRKESSRLAGVD